jgi:dipeptidyl aminopeptidase/acylaminoacyl peptidase
MRYLRIAIVLVIIALIGYTGYVGYEGSSQLLAVDEERGYKPYCFTPEMYAGWDYEAVNYDRAADEDLPWVDAAGAREAKDVEDAYDVDCGDLRGTAGDDIVTPDGIHVAAWYIPAANPTDTTILVVHGNPANKSDALRYAAFLHDDYNLLLPDLRNSSRSTGDLSTTGIHEYQEVEAILDWLVETKAPDHIGALGDSGGAAAILKAARNDQRVEAIVSDSVHARLATEVGAEMGNQSPPHPMYPGLWGIQLAFWIRSGHGVNEADPIISVASLGDRPYLIIHGTDDRANVPADSAELLLAAATDAGVPARLQYCEGGTHGQTTYDCADQYGGWVNDFFATAFAGGD